MAKTKLRRRARTHTRPRDEARSPSRPNFGLAFSGGGVRSASGSSGVLCFMAAHNLMQHVTDISSVSGGGYLASSLLALQHAYQESHPEGKQPPRSPHTNKVQLPSKVMFAYLTALQENVGIFVEGWSGRFFVDMAAFLWTLSVLVVVNVLTYVPQALVYSEVYAFILSHLDDKRYMADWHWETMAAFLGTAVAGFCAYKVLIAIIASCERQQDRRAGHQWTNEVSGLSYDPKKPKLFPVRNFLGAFVFMLFSIWFCGFIAYLFALANEFVAAWVSALIVICLCLVSAFVVFKKIKLPRVQATLSLIYVVAVIAQIINYRVDPDSAAWYSADHGLTKAFSRTFMFWGGAYVVFLYPLATWLKYDKLPTFNQFRLRRAFYPPSVTVARRTPGATLDDQWANALAPKRGWWARTIDRWAGLLSVTSNYDDRIHDPRLGCLDTETLYKYSCQVAVHGWLRIDVPWVENEMTFTAGTFRPGSRRTGIDAGMRRLDCSLNATLNSQIPLPRRHPRPHAIGMRVLPPLPAGNVRLSRAMAISAAALADDLGTEGSNVTSKLRATTVTTGISLGFWFDNLASRNRLRKIAQGYLVWFIVSGWLLLYPLTASGQWPSMVMACMWTLYGALMNYLASKGPMPFGLDIFSICRQIQQLNKVERYTDAGDQLPRNLYLTDGGHASNLSITSILCPNFDNFRDNGAAGSFTPPATLRVIVYDGGTNSDGNSTGLDRAWLLCFRYYGCTFYPVDDHGSLLHPTAGGTTLGEAEGNRAVADEALFRDPSQNLPDMNRYKANCWLLEQDEPEPKARCWMAFEVVYPGQERKWGVGDDRSAWQEANIVLYLVPRERCILPPPYEARHSLDDAAKAHINECHYDHHVSKARALKDTYGFCCDRCNCTGTTKCCGRFPNTATIPNQFFTPRIQKAYHQVGFSVAAEACHAFPSFFGGSVLRSHEY